MPGRDSTRTLLFIFALHLLLFAGFYYTISTAFIFGLEPHSRGAAVAYALLRLFIFYGLLTVLYVGYSLVIPNDPYGWYPVVYKIIVYSWPASLIYVIYVLIPAFRF